MSAINDWLAAHALTTVDLRAVNATWTEHAITFPVYSRRGKRVFAIVRNLAGSPKYDFQPPHVRPSAVLYGLHRFVTPPGATIIVVEGPADALALAARGIRAVASMTSRMSDLQKAQLDGLRIMIWGDGDSAGRRFAATAPWFGVSIDGDDPASALARRNFSLSTFLRICVEQAEACRLLRLHSLAPGDFEAVLRETDSAAV